MTRSRLLPRLNNCARPRAELLCFPHAGGSASYFQRWAPHLPDGLSLCALQLPRREERLDAAPIEDMEHLITDLLAEIPASPAMPLILFGHSMGAIVAWELALALQARGQIPQHLYISGQTPPDIQRQTAFHQASDEELLAEVMRFSATPASLLEFPALRELVLEQLRHDYRLIERWRPSTLPTLNAPITVLHGRADSEVTLPEASGWAHFSKRRFRLFSWPGDHFYLTARWQDVLQRVCQDASLTSFDMP